jgi:hypothetical protein
MNLDVYIFIRGTVTANSFVSESTEHNLPTKHEKSQRTHF